MKSSEVYEILDILYRSNKLAVRMWVMEKGVCGVSSSSDIDWSEIREVSEE